MKDLHALVRITAVMIMLNTSLMAENVGQKLSDFTLPSLENKSQTVSFKKLKENVILLNFWASWCNSCKQELPLLEALGEKFKEKKFKVVLVNLDRKKEMGLGIIQVLQKGTNQPLAMVSLHDKEKKLFKQHPAQGYPYTLLIKDGEIIADYLGSFDEKSILTLEEKIKSLL